MYFYDNSELNAMLRAEGFKDDLDETAEFELETEQLIWDDEFQTAL